MLTIEERTVSKVVFSAVRKIVVEEDSSCSVEVRVCSVSCRSGALTSNQTPRLKHVNSGRGVLRNCCEEQTQGLVAKERLKVYLTVQKMPGDGML